MSLDVLLALRARASQRFRRHDHLLERRRPRSVWLLGFAMPCSTGCAFAPLRWLLARLDRNFPRHAVSGAAVPPLRRRPLRRACGSSATAAGVLGLGLYSSAYFAEIFRAGFAAVPRGQIEAAMSIGMNPLDTLLRVTLPAR